MIRVYLVNSKTSKPIIPSFFSFKSLNKMRVTRPPRSHRPTVPVERSRLPVYQLKATHIHRSHSVRGSSLDNTRNKGIVWRYIHSKRNLANKENLSQAHLIKDQPKAMETRSNSCLRLQKLQSFSNNGTPRHSIKNS